MPKKLNLIRVRLDRPNTRETLDTNQDFFETSASNGKLKPIVLSSDYHMNSDLTFLSISFLSRFEANLRKIILHGIKTRALCSMQMYALQVNSVL